jgi:regulator of telomere elongation helicase 1
VQQCEFTRVPRRQINPLSPPTTMVLSGVRIHFPFRPYPCQEAYMQTVMNALLKSENALLESPPGSGKTLCLLCACLAWQRHETTMLLHTEQLDYLSTINQTAAAAARSGGTNVDQRGASGATKPRVEYKRRGPPTIIYASRSQSQLDHVVKELRSTRYRPTHAVLGSREQMCIHPHINRPTMTESDVSHGCYKLEQKRACPYRNNLDGFMTPSNEYMPSTSSSCCQSGSATAAAASAPTHKHQSVRDMEELVAMGKVHSVCPFYYTQLQIENAELILVPYNFLFDKAAREEAFWDIPWDNTVVIFDDAHNLETFCSESMSFEITSADIAGCIREVQKVSASESRIQGVYVVFRYRYIVRKEVVELTFRWCLRSGNKRRRSRI